MPSNKPAPPLSEQTTTQIVVGVLFFMSAGVAVIAVVLRDGFEKADAFPLGFVGLIEIWIFWTVACEFRRRNDEVKTKQDDNDDNV